MNFNDAIVPLTYQRTSDDFSNALEIARSCSLGDPLLEVTTNTAFTFDQGFAAVDGFRSITISSDIGSPEARCLIAALTTLDVAAVVDLRESSMDSLALLRERVWELSSRRGDYEYLLTACPPEVSGLVGLLIGAAQRNICTVIEGVDAFAAALLAQRIAYRSVERALSAQLPLDPAALEAQRRLRLPVVLSAAVPKSAAVVAVKHLHTTLALTAN